jgi:5'-3' exonuclease
MGVHSLFKLLETVGTPVKWNMYSGQTIGIDASIFIYATTLGMQSINALTSVDGEPTSFLNALFALIIKFKKLSITPIMIFDGVPPELKKMTLADRRKRRQDAAERIAALNADAATDLTGLELAQLLTERAQLSVMGETRDTSGQVSAADLEKRAFTITDKIVEDTKLLLDMMGVKYINSPDGFEAEQMAAGMQQEGIIHAVYTADADALVFGAERMIRRVKEGKLIEYTLDRVMSTLGITNREELANIAVSLGCDFAPKVRGIGEKSYKRGMSAEHFTEEQLAARNFFLAPPPLDMSQMHTSPENCDQAIRWLVDIKGFNEDRLKKMLTSKVH